MCVTMKHWRLSYSLSLWIYEVASVNVTVSKLPGLHLTRLQLLKRKEGIRLKINIISTNFSSPCHSRRLNNPHVNPQEKMAVLLVSFPSVWVNTHRHVCHLEALLPTCWFVSRFECVCVSHTGLTTGSSHIPFRSPPVTNLPCFAAEFCLLRVVFLPLRGFSSRQQ